MKNYNKCKGSQVMCDPRLSMRQDSTLRLSPYLQTVTDMEVEKLNSKFIKACVSVMLLGILSGCGSTIPYTCTSRNAEICDLQYRMVRIEDRLQYPRAKGKAAVVMTDQELKDELRRRGQVVTYPTQ